MSDKENEKRNFGRNVKPQETNQPQQQVQYPRSETPPPNSRQMRTNWVSTIRTSYLYVYNLANVIGIEKFKEEFGKFGQLVEEKTEVKEAEDGSKFGIVLFVKLEDAKKAMDGMNGKDLKGEHLVVTFEQLEDDVLMIPQ